VHWRLKENYYRCKYLLSLSKPTSPNLIQSPSIRRRSRRRRLGTMGPESGSSRRVGSRTCAKRKRGQDVGCHGHAAGVERQARQLQDTARAEGSRGAA